MNGKMHLVVIAKEFFLFTFVHFLFYDDTAILIVKQVTFHVVCHVKFFLISGLRNASFQFQYLKWHVAQTEENSFIKIY